MIAAFTAGIVNILLSLFVYIKNPKKDTNIFFALMAFSIALWNFADAASFIENPAIALFYFRCFYIAGIFIPTFSIHFMVSIVKDVIHKDWKKVFIIIYTGVIILSGLMFTPYIIKEVALRPCKEVPVPYIFFL
jgi:hypothetical protein